MTDVVGLLAELNDLKRVGIAEKFFRSAWAAIFRGEPASEVALRTTAHFVASARLGGIDRAVLREAGLSDEEITEILARSFGFVFANPDSRLLPRLHFEVADGEVPEFVDLLCRQPRAGATSPGKARIVVSPMESHGDHCLMVAVYSVLLAPRFGASVEIPFLAGLAHHLHNAYLPDSGYTGEEMLGARLESVVNNFRERALGQLSGPVQTEVRAALQAVANAETPEGQAFHAADVIDRVLQMKWYEQAAGFKLGMAMEDMQLVHAGPVQAFHRAVLRDAGLW